MDTTAIAVVIPIAAATLVWLAFLRARRLARARAHPSDEELARAARQLGVSFDDEELRRDIGRIHEAVRWSDVRRIAILTNDKGPFLEDVHWLFEGHATGCVVPGLAMTSELLRALERFDGIDYRAVTDAMTCTDNAVFEVWRAPEVRQAPPARADGAC